MHGARAGLAAVLFAAGCAQGALPDAPHDSVGESSAATGCELGRLGEAVVDALADANEERALVPTSQAVTLWNRADAALIEGPAIFGALADAIATAEREVDISTFVWDVGSDPSDELLGGIVRLERRLRAKGAPPDGPVQVRLLVYANRLSGSRGVAAPLVRAVDALDLDSRYVQVAVATRSSWGLGAMHQKLALVDGRLAHVGGANVEDVHGWSDGQTPWHDSAYLLEGEIAHSLLAAFDAMWAEAKRWSCNRFWCRSHDVDAPDRAAQPAHLPPRCSPMFALTRRPRGGANNDVDDPQGQGYLAAMRAARRRIDIVTPNLNDDAAKTAIRRAVARGVEVRILLSLGFNERTESLPGQGGGNADNVDALYAWAKRSLGPEQACQRLRVRWYSSDGRAPVEGNGPGASHLKYMAIDGQMAIVGSANMDTQSWNHSGEVNVAVDDWLVAHRWNRQVFAPDFARGTPTGHCD